MNCSKHTKEVAGITDMAELAKMIGDLHYETLAELLHHLSNKIFKDAQNDAKGGRVKLGLKLLDASNCISKATGCISKAWQISKPFMKTHQGK